MATYSLQIVSVMVRSASKRFTIIIPRSAYLYILLIRETGHRWLLRGVGTGGGQGAAAPKKIGTGAAPPQTKKHRKAQKNDESALRAARSARRAKGKAEEKTTVLKTEGATL